MAKKVTGYIKLQIPAGKATPAPPVGPALGQHGVNIVQFTKEFNARTADQGDLIIPVVITVYADRSFSFITKTPPAAVLLKKAAKIKSGSGGASMAGGSGSMIGALAGSILMGMISNALILAILSSAQQKMVNGFIIIAAVALSNLAQRKKSN